ncbi:carbamoyltransferase family protein [Vibrio mediterranei]|uniref:carbamoyltransferase family protein n=1 Tax=Vibrio mediterranei TaxID=689 RepID=UPI00148DA958|nr:carbamoyltransferase C-terminal domain-containing protein [Vibrio mediterranei]NOH31506.1 hypothetical protein [Vibrio mediterranei]
MKNDKYILGFSDSVHDRSVCLLKNNKILIAIEEERLSRVRYGIDFGDLDKTDHRVFSKLNLDYETRNYNEGRLLPLLNYCLNETNLTIDDIDLMIGNSLNLATPFIDRAVYINHHYAHAASCFYTSGLNEAAILVIDGYGDQLSEDNFETVSIFYGIGNCIKSVYQFGGNKVGSHLRHSLGIFYRIATLLSGFGIMDEGKTMGLAAYGNPIYAEQILSYVTFTPTDILIENDDIFHHFSEIRKDTNFSNQADIAASFQLVIEKMINHYALLAIELTGVHTLCITGGVGLNCVANQKLMNSGNFEDIFIFPAPADNGISVGAAYVGAHRIFNLPRCERIQSISLGKRYSDGEIELALKNYNLSYELKSDTELYTELANCLVLDQVVMWYQGGSEFGPRALGYRSILADPRNKDVRTFINKKIKSRENFRPLSPAILAEHCDMWFSCSHSPFMLFTPDVDEICRERAPGIVHQDGTARVQSVEEHQNPHLYKLLLAFYHLTDVPLLLNTSFNTQGEPIVETPSEAIRTFLESPVTVLCIGSFIVRKNK